jgi:sodium/potassium-transporting ATPase subunit alpha
VIVILISGICSYMTMRGSEAILDSFKTMNLAEVLVRRNGKEFSPIPVHELCKGDVVKIKGGDKVPADIRIFKTSGIKVDNSPLNGESIPVKIGTEPGDKGVADAMSALNLMFYSTLCKEGEGIGVVINIGEKTFMGRIADLTESAEGELTTLQVEINKFITLIAIIACSLGIIFFFLGIIVQYPIVTNFIFALGIVIANVPEGLGYSVTTILAITAQKMYQRKVFIKKLQSVETLGSITCICSDKTGTLTQNKMTVVHLWYDREFKGISRDQEDVRLDDETFKLRMYDQTDASWEKFRFAGVCGSFGVFDDGKIPDDFPQLLTMKKKWEMTQRKIDQAEANKAVDEIKKQILPDYQKWYNDPANIDERRIETDPTEAGILKFFEKLKKIEETRKAYPPLPNDCKVPFNSSLKFACYVRQRETSNGLAYSIAYKGAPEKLIERCNRYLLKGKEHAMTKDFKDSFWQANKFFALKGERVIGLAYVDLDPSTYASGYEFKVWTEMSSGREELRANFPLENLVFTGVVAMEDPPK